VAQGSLSLREYLDTAVALATDAGAFVLSSASTAVTP
jgi:hypothetical protein